MRPVALLSLLVACNTDKGAMDTAPGDSASAWRPDVVCPGDAGCETNAGVLMAGAAALPITPTCFEGWVDSDGNAEYHESSEEFLDCGCDQLCEGDEGWPGADEGEGDGQFQAVWISGFGTARAAQGVHDELEARAVVFSTGDTTVAIVSVDLVGFFYNYTERVREAVDAMNLGVDHVIVSATHVHEGPDTMGQWGQRVGQSGVDDDYIAYVISQVAAAVQTAVGELEPAKLYAGDVDTAAPFGSRGTRATTRDSRDPVVIDEQMGSLLFMSETGGTIASVLNWGNHPEALSGDNLELTSDFVHYVREGVENGITYDAASHSGIGGVCVYLSAEVGGLMTPLGINVIDPDGNEFESASFEKAEALGNLIAGLALDSFDSFNLVEDPTVSVRATELYIPMENYGFQALYLVGVFDRPAYNYDPDQNFDEDNRPELKTGMSFVGLGPVRFLTVPGELFPELAIGGYDGSHLNTDEVEFIDSNNPNPPDVANAPEGPYLKERMGGETNLILGLGNDEIGYLVPPYDYVLSESSPYLNEAEGDHYEETNSVGPSAVPLVLETADLLIDYTE